MAKEVRRIWVQALTRSNIGAAIEMANGVRGIIQNFERFDNTMVVTLAVPFDIPNNTEITIID